MTSSRPPTMTGICRSIKTKSNSSPLLSIMSRASLPLLAVSTLCPDFFSTQNPETTDARQAFIPVQGLHLFDNGGISPWVPAIVGKRNPVTLRMEWTTDPNKKVPVRFFAPGASYRVLGLFSAKSCYPNRSAV